MSDTTIAASDVPVPPLEGGVEEEREYVGLLYSRLDELRAEKEEQLRDRKSVV